MMTDWKDQLDRAIAQRSDHIVEVRRHLHANPEPSGQEHGTSLFLYQLLGNEQIEVRQGPEGRGVVADLQSDQAPSCAGRLALRADIDALHIQDHKVAPYRSQRPGVMHACGHDAHSAILVGTLLTINQLCIQGQLPWPVRLRGVFQPSEETATGAREMIEADSLEGVAAILALHVDPTRPTGQIGVRQGVFTASCDDMRVTIVGRGGHAARPHEASDPITAAAQLINSLYLHIPRATDSRDAVVITIGKIEGGDNANVIPGAVTLGGTIRTLDGDVRRKTMDHIRRLAQGVALATETKIDAHFGLGAPSIFNDASLVAMLRGIGREVLGPDGVVEIARPSMGSEDFALYLEQVPGAMFRLDCAPQGAGQAPGLHTSVFDIDEQSMQLGVRILARAVMEWFDPSRLPSSPTGPQPTQRNPVLPS
jgi:amidohydrolase